MMTEKFQYLDQRFADIQLLRYRLKGFEHLTLQQKKYIYCLSEATLMGRDILFDQNGKYNLRLRRLFEAIYLNYSGNRDDDEFQHVCIYLKQMWFSNGIYHHYSSDKIKPQFTADYLKKIVCCLSESNILSLCHETIETIVDELFPVIFNPDLLPKKVNKSQCDDLILSSACNFYEGVSQKEVETFYNQLKNKFEKQPKDEIYRNEEGAQPSWGINSKVVKTDGNIEEVVCKIDGLYGETIKSIVFWLDKAKAYAENNSQRDVIKSLIEYYTTGSLTDFDRYSILWTLAKEGEIDFVNGFIEVYSDPLGLKATWEGIVEYIDHAATQRSRIISSNAQWFEDHSPVDCRFKKEKVKGISANVVCAAMLGGDEYPSSAIGINLPNANWIRSVYGSKSVTIGNLTEAYNESSKGNGFFEEFVCDQNVLEMIRKYDKVCDDLHTDLHECLGHGSGKMMPNVGDDALKAYGSTIEEARADLFGLYYMADEKLLELKLLPDKSAYRAHYYTYMLNGLLTQLIRIKPGGRIEEDHMRNRALIANWVVKHANNSVRFVKHDNKTYLEIDDYKQLRSLFAELLCEIQRIKSCGDYEAAKNLVENYGVSVDEKLHSEILQRYSLLNLAPYKGFINPRFYIERDADNNVVDIRVDYTETYEQQMLRYSSDYSSGKVRIG